MKKERISALVIDDDELSLRLTVDIVKLYGISAEYASAPEEARRLLSERTYDIVLCDTICSACGYPEKYWPKIVEGALGEVVRPYIVGLSADETYIKYWKIKGNGDSLMCNRFYRKEDFWRDRSILESIIKENSPNPK